MCLYRYYSSGSSIRPINRMAPVLCSLIRYRKGRLAKNWTGSFGSGTAVSLIAITVTAAASVPSSFTSTNVFCLISDTYKFSDNMFWRLYINKK